MEMPDGSFQRTVTVKSAFLTVTLLERGEQLTANISLDSLILDRPNPILQPLVDSAQGIRWQGVVEKTGRLDSLTASRPSVLSEQVRAMLSRLWPILPDSGAAPGDQWESQATLPYQIMVGFEGREVRQARFRSAKWENVHGIRALTVHSTMEYTVSGSGSGFGQEIMVEGSGRAQGTHRISVAGVVIESEVDDSVKMMLTVPAVGQTVPTMVVTRYSLSPLP